MKTDGTSEPRQQPSKYHRHKRAYEPPRLIVFGDVKTLTTGGGSCIQENCGTGEFLGGRS